MGTATASFASKEALFASKPRFAVHFGKRAIDGLVQSSRLGWVLMELAVCSEPKLFERKKR